MMKSDQKEKLCASCGRPMQWRKAWEKNWDSIRYCSDSCRRQKLDKKGSDIQETLMALVYERGASKSICPSEVARKLWPEGWEEHMEEVRRIARQLHSQGMIEITQKGRVVQDLNFKGPIRLRIKSQIKPH